MPVSTPPLPALENPHVVIPAPGPGPGNWAGAASAVLVDGVTYLAYRVRRPTSLGRGVSTIVARSRDGLEFETVCEVHRASFGAESFERPVVLCRPDGGWRLYLSCATPGSKHWWIEALDADRPEALPEGRRTVVHPGSAEVAAKDPVITVRDGLWEMWLCEHPLTDPGEEDRMSTAYLTSADGLDWTRHGTVLEPRAGTWDARGTRVTTVLSHDPLVVLYDGRPDAASNWHETTSLARADATGCLHADPAAPVLRSPESDGALRYASAVPLPDGSTRFYFEMARPDGAHDLVTTLSSP
jgi:hypothetical protein